MNKCRARDTILSPRDTSAKTMHSNELRQRSTNVPQSNLFLTIRNSLISSSARTEPAGCTSYCWWYAVESYPYVEKLMPTPPG